LQRLCPGVAGARRTWREGRQLPSETEVGGEKRRGGRDAGCFRHATEREEHVAKRQRGMASGWSAGGGSSFASSRARFPEWPARFLGGPRNDQQRVARQGFNRLH
jgi:hypothetical protein